MGKIRTAAAKKYHGNEDDNNEEVITKKTRASVTPSKRRTSSRAAPVAKTPTAKTPTPARRSSGRHQQVEKEVSSSESEAEEESAPVEQPKRKSNTPKNQTNGESSAEKKPPIKKGKIQKAEREDYYEVEDILGHKVEDGTKYFLIRWKGFDSSADTWERQNNISSPALVAQYYEKHPDARMSAKRKVNRKRKVQPPPPVRKLKIDQQLDYDDEDFDKDEDYEVERILDVIVHRNNKREFLIRWKGYSSNVDSWEPEENLNCKDLIAKYMDKVEQAKNSSVKDLRPVRAQTQRFTLMTQEKDRRLSKRNFNRQRAVYHDCQE